MIACDVSVKPGARGGDWAARGAFADYGAPPRILHISKHCGYGNGNVHVAVDLACVQARAGYQVWFASGGRLRKIGGLP